MKVEIGPYPDDDSIHDEQVIDVHIDEWDTWNMDNTLAHIILPMLKQLKETKAGSSRVAPEDVPEHLQPTQEEIDLYNTNGQTDSKFFDRWDWVMDEMIFAFDSLAGEGKDWEDRFWSGEMDIYFDTMDDGSGNFEMKHGPNHTLDCDMDGLKLYQARITNGFRLFGKYYQGLWD